MNNMKKKVLKGFTLVELIVVMAVFGLLLIAVISIANPVSKIFKNTESAEKTYANTNNIQLYLQNTLQYADNMIVHTADTVTEDDLADWANTFVEKYYMDVVTKNTAVTGVNIDASEYMDGKVYIMRLANNDSTDIDAGQIYLYTYNFNTHSDLNKYCEAATPALAPPAENMFLASKDAVAVPQLNRAYFDAADAKYNFSYALGPQVLKTVNVSGSSDTYRAIANDIKQPVPLREADGSIKHDDEGNVLYDEGVFEDVKIDSNTLNYRNFAISIITSMQDDSGASHSDYALFKDPTSISVANIQLLNMNFRAASATATRVVMERRYCKKFDPVLNDDGSEKKDVNGNLIYSADPVIRLQDGSEDSFIATDIYDTVDMSKDIFIVFSYADELVLHK